MFDSSELADELQALKDDVAALLNTGREAFSPQREQTFESIRGHWVNRPVDAGLRMEPLVARASGG